MKKSISNLIMVVTLVLSFTANHAQIKNTTSHTLKIYGNCGMCEKTIEKAGNLINVATVNWNNDTKMAALTYDAKKTNQVEILKRIALAGYDSDKFLALDDAYASLYDYCQYDREAKVPVKAKFVAHNHDSETKEFVVQETYPLKSVFENYFAVKEALVQTDELLTSKSAAKLFSAVNNVKMEKLEMDVQVVWMKMVSDLKINADKISKSKNISQQRDHFITLSKNMYALIKVSKTEKPIYYQFCPMANNSKGANWLSKENDVKNPYYGSKMLSCGKTVEIIK